MDRIEAFRICTATGLTFAAANVCAAALIGVLGRRQVEWRAAALLGLTYRSVVSTLFYSAMQRKDKIEGGYYDKTKETESTTSPGKLRVKKEWVEGRPLDEEETISYYAITILPHLLHIVLASFLIKEVSWKKATLFTAFDLLVYKTSVALLSGA